MKTRILSIAVLVLMLLISACGTPQSAAPDAAAAVKIDPLSESAALVAPIEQPAQTSVPISQGVHVTLSLNNWEKDFTFMRLILSSTKGPLGQMFAYVFVNGVQVNGVDHEAWGHPCSDTAIATLECDIAVVEFRSFAVKVTDSEGKSCQVSLKVPLQVTKDGAFDDAACEFK